MKQAVVLCMCVAMMLLVGCQGCNEPESTEEVAEQLSISTPALEQLDQQIAKDPNNEKLYYQRALALSKLGELTKAIGDIEKAIAIEPKAYHYLFLSQLHFTNQDVTRALNAVQEGHERFPKDNDILKSLTRYYIYLEKFDKAIEHADKALLNNVYEADAYFLKGVVFEAVQDTARALSSYTTAIEQEPQLYDGHMKLGILYSNRKNELALQYFENASRIKPEEAEPRYGKAKFLQDAGKEEEAIATYRDLIVNSPNFEKAYYNLGYIYFQRDSIDKAQKNFNIAVQVAPTYTDAYYMRGLCSEAKGENEKALEDYKQVLHIDGNHTMALRGLTRVRKQE